MQYTYTLRFSAEDEDQARALWSVLDHVAPFVVDNPESYVADADGYRLDADTEGRSKW